jgi:glycerol uptake facilitator protein
LGGVLGGGTLLAGSTKAWCEPAVLKSSQPKPTPTQSSKLLAEAVGTAIIVQGGCGVVCALKFAGSNLGSFGISAVWGASVCLAVYATRHISGAHLNPAVTAALVACDKFPAEEAPLYVAAQCAGATIAGAANYLIFAAGIAASEARDKIVRSTPRSTATFAGAFGMVPNSALLGPVGALAAEVWMTAVLAFLIFAITDDKGTVPPDAAPALIGASVMTLVSVFGPVTGCGMNPARDLGPRLVTALAGWGGAAATSAWIYTLGPVAGAIIGGKFYCLVYAEQAEEKA